MNKTIGILLGGDLLIALLTAQLGVLAHMGAPEVAESLPVGSEKMLPFAAALIVTGFVSELYTSDRLFEQKEALLRIFFSLFLAFLLLSGLYFFVPEFSVSRGMLASSLAAFGVIQFLWHYRFPLLLKAPGFARRVLIVGTGPLAREMAELMENGKNPYVFLGYIAAGGDACTVATRQIVGNIDELVENARALKASKIIISLTERRGVLPVRDVLKCKLRGIEIIDAMSFYERVTGKLKVESINPSWFIFSDGFRLTALMKVSKRMLDVVLALLGLALASPLMPIIALAIKIDSPGPILFKQLRTGEGEKPFHVYKFRSMRQDAEKGTGAVWAQKNDPRITRWGAFMRKTRLDEIPQLFNVVKGDMSFVGPRPERPEFVETLKEKIPYYSSRHTIKPGVTGWAQVKYPYGASEEDALEKLRYDLYYIKNYSLLLDIGIILETFKVVIFGRGQ